MSNQELVLYNTLTKKKEVFKPLNPPFVGLYVCGPTVYGDAHLGHARAAITFDVLFRYLTYIGYKVRYVRNITDVGHLENDADSGEDKIAKKARLEQLEPMEVVQYYTDRYHKNMEQLNTLKPSIEPRASAHIIEQIDMTRKIINGGYGYISNGSVYFDVVKYNKEHAYGKLSGRVLEELLEHTRELNAQEEKRHPADFALWKKAEPQHIMRWHSQWSDGFPGWHIECSVMSAKYLGDVFDIHGGGMDLLFPHHECEIAQSNAANHKDPARYWLHNNMVTVNGQKMGKSLNNFVTLDELFSGNHSALTQAYSPMTVRFFILQAHYRGTLDFSNEALQAAEKAYKRLMQALNDLKRMNYSGFLGTASEVNNEIKQIAADCYAHINDDLNTAMVIADLFAFSGIVNKIKAGQISLGSITEENFSLLKNTFIVFAENILGLKNENENVSGNLVNGLMEMILNVRQNAKKNKDFETSDKIRNELAKLGIQIKDSKDKTEWSYE